MPYQILQKESGRSMVEMLGVLVIIGVLSIGGVVGYSYAMDKSRANRALNDIRLRAVTLQAQNAMGRDLDLSEYNGMDTVYDITPVALNDGGYGLNISNVPERICRMIFDGMISWTERLTINDTNATNSDLCSATNTMTFIFNPNGTITEKNEGNVENTTNEDTITSEDLTQPTIPTTEPAKTIITTESSTEEETVIERPGNWYQNPDYGSNHLSCYGKETVGSGCVNPCPQGTYYNHLNYHNDKNIECMPLPSHTIDCYEYDNLIFGHSGCICEPGYIMCGGMYPNAIQAETTTQQETTTQSGW